MNIAIEASWKVFLEPEFSKPYFASLVSFLRKEKQEKKTIFPNEEDIFNAFYLTPFEQVKVIILGQDPYHNPMQAHGLSFSVKENIPIPPSLRNIFKELENDLGCPKQHCGDLSTWAKQGVLLLNAALTVEENKPMSHSHIGWHNFSDAVIQNLSEHKQHLVFILWGRFAQTKASLINSSKHLIIQSAHPSPLSAHKGFLGSKPFSKTNNYLKTHKLPLIDWCL